MDSGKCTLTECPPVLTWFSGHGGGSVCLCQLLPDCNQTHQCVQKKARKFPPKICYTVTRQGIMTRVGVAAATTLFSTNNKYLCNVRGALSRSHIRNLPLNAFLHQPWNIHALCKVFMWTSVQVSPRGESVGKLRGSNILSKQYSQLC